MREPWEYLLQFVCVALMMCFVALKMKYDGKTADEWMEERERKRGSTKAAAGAAKTDKGAETAAAEKKTD